MNMRVEFVILLILLLLGGEVKDLFKLKFISTRATVNACTEAFTMERSYHESIAEYTTQFLNKRTWNWIIWVSWSALLLHSLMKYVIKLMRPGSVLVMRIRKFGVS
jgi:hypothetical protein